MTSRTSVFRQADSMAFFSLEKKKRPSMKVYVLFFITYTLMQILFSSLYLMMVQHIDLTLIMGTAIYLFGMYRGYEGYQYFRYKEKRKKMIEALLSE